MVAPGGGADNRAGTDPMLALTAHDRPTPTLLKRPSTTGMTPGAQRRSDGAVESGKIGASTEAHTTSGP
jgi:hypothetical protein